MSTIANPWSRKISWTVRVVRCALLLATSGFLLRSAFVTSFSTLFGSRDSVVQMWDVVETWTGLLLLPVCGLAVSRLRVADWAAVFTSAIAVSIFAAQEALILVDRFSDQTYLLNNQYLLAYSPIPPLVVAVCAVIMSFVRLNRDSQEMPQWQY
jgi:hypothetical protein